ncbi:PIF-2 [Dikerogammarus haemobaphes nudivirus]|nr:PIF-2 [Dikerogammarus haemobaphes nudivirus]
MNLKKITMDVDKSNTLGWWYMVVLSLIIIFIIIFYFSLFNIDISEYSKYVLNLKSDVYNKPLLELLTGNTLVNLPNVIINTDTEYINNLQKCKNGAIYLGPDNGTDYSYLCKSSCGGVGELMTLGDSDEYYQDGEKLDSGVYCILNPPKCNMNTSYVVATVNSTICKSKYPNMFGGPTGGEIIACNNEKYPATGSELWDYANNEVVVPTTVVMTHEDERLDNGDYRFQCKFNETGMGNPYIPNPMNRFHPLTDKCNSTIYRASYDVHANVTDDAWNCECGDFSETRVKHLDANNPKSICTSCYFEEVITDLTKVLRKAKIPYLCFNQSSVWSDALKMPPCLDLPEQGNRCETFEVEYRKDKIEEDVPYPKFGHDYGVCTRDFLRMDINTIDPDYVSEQLLPYKQYH